MNTLYNFITNDIKPFKNTASIQEAQDFFSELPYSHFPVLEGNTFIGCLSKEKADILNSYSKIDDHRFEYDRFYTLSSMIWFDVLKIFTQNKTNLVPVLDEKNNYLGYYELEDVISFLFETPFFKEDGGFLVVKKDITQFSFSQISQIIESNDGKLLGSFISNMANGKVEITIKTNQSDFNKIIQAFRRYEYEIISEHQEDFYLNNLKERSDYLDKYLNI